jgi:hypothetical protein
MRALVIFESMYGNTRAVAQAVAEGIGASGGVQVNVVPVGEASGDMTKDADLLVIGGPTHAHGMSRFATRSAALAAAAKPGSGLTADPAAEGPGVREWLAQLDHQGGTGAAFDTRMSGPAIFTGSAAVGIARGLWRSGVTVISKPQSFLVTKSTELRPGEIARAQAWGRQLSELAAARLSGQAAGATATS